MAYTICYTTPDGRDGWTREETRDGVVDFLQRNNLEGDPDILIFGHDADDEIQDVEDFMKSGEVVSIYEVPVQLVVRVKVPALDEDAAWRKASSIDTDVFLDKLNQMFKDDPFSIDRVFGKPVKEG